ncbi:MAG: hypothetical protein L6R35_005862, partial [Caloplaca aegaea]
TFDSQISSFYPGRPTQRPRAWERLPKSSHSKRHKGRKVWKRYEPLQRNPAKEDQKQMQDGQHDPPELSGLIDSTHIAKRLRSQHSTNEGPEMGLKPSRYVTTLRDKASGTPRRKLASNTTLRLDRPKAIRPPAVSVEETLDEAFAPQQLGDEITSLELLQQEEIRDVYSDPVQPTEGPLSEDVEEALSSPRSEKLVKRITDQNKTPVNLHAEEAGCAARSTAISVEGDDEAAMVSTTADPTEATNHASGLDSTSAQPEMHLLITEMFSSDTSPAEHGHTTIEPRLIDDVPTDELLTLRDIEYGEQTIERLNDNVTPEQVNEERMIDPVSERGSRGQEPRRSSRRVPEKKNDGLHSEVAEAQSMCADPLAVTSRETAGDFAYIQSMKNDQARKKKGSSHLEKPARRRSSHTGEEDGNINMGSRTSVSGSQESVEEEKPTAQGIEDETPNSSTSELMINEPGLVLRGDENTKSPSRTSTRSGTRFSDDTNMLKDFLSRVQARKHAKDAFPIAKPAAAAASPRRSPRKALASLDSNSPSPRKWREVSGREVSDWAGTPPGKAKLEAVQLEEVDETVADASPVRRSTRKRLLAPAKTVTGAPSFIPVRRADGTDPVVLQKTIAQELALVTRTNTRRNKGQAKPPALILKSLGVEEVEKETKGGHALRNCKSVGWDKKLVYYQDGRPVQADAEVMMEEKRPKARRLRGLGAGNGTPAPKRQMADLLGTNGTPASNKTHGRRG